MKVTKNIKCCEFDPRTLGKSLNLVEPVYVIIEDALKETNSKKGKTIEIRLECRCLQKCFLI